ncbi:MAG: 4Fe-4S binding protein [Candidatus Fermentibacteraceae bacterium]|nr:4Fe-4S binding protein [Candidatus Fermentibacteraceae bacterium]MBN2609143.1 4Fe-4S binding protein [Candidatus Fermentibacteraceae bacterium]
MAKKSSPAEKASAAEKNRGKAEATAFVHVFPEWCKGCGICVAFCPTGVIEMKGQKAVVVYPEKCVRCYLCARRCPDLAIGIEDSEGRVNGTYEKPRQESLEKGEGGSR